MDTIPISFEHLGKQYTGHFSKVMGAGSGSTYYLMDDKNFYLGRLRIANEQWTFDASPKKQELKDVADFFGDYIINWQQ